MGWPSTLCPTPTLLPRCPGANIPDPHRPARLSSTQRGAPPAPRWVRSSTRTTTRFLPSRYPAGAGAPRSAKHEKTGNEPAVHAKFSAPPLGKPAPPHVLACPRSPPFPPDLPPDRWASRFRAAIACRAAAGLASPQQPAGINPPTRAGFPRREGVPSLRRRIYTRRVLRGPQTRERRVSTRRPLRGFPGTDARASR